MERKTVATIAPVLLGSLLSFLFNSKKTALTFSIELTSGIATALYIAPHTAQYIPVPENLAAFILGTASAKICRAIYDRFNSPKFNPIDLIMNTPVSQTQEDLKDTSNNV